MSQRCENTFTGLILLGRFVHKMGIQFRLLHILVSKATLFIQMTIAIQQDCRNLDTTASTYRLVYLQVSICWRSLNTRLSLIYALDSRFPNLQPPRPVLKAPKAPNPPDCPGAWLPSPPAEVGLATEPRSLLLKDDRKPDWGKEECMDKNLLGGGRSSLLYYNLGVKSALRRDEVHDKLLT